MDSAVMGPVRQMRNRGISCQIIQTTTLRKQSGYETSSKSVRAIVVLILWCGL